MSWWSVVQTTLWSSSKLYYHKKSQAKKIWPLDCDSITDIRRTWNPSQQKNDQQWLQLWSLSDSLYGYLDRYTFCPLSLINAAISKSRSCRFSLTYLSKQSVRETVSQQLYFSIYWFSSCCLAHSRLVGSVQHSSLRPFRQDGSVRVENMFFVQAWLSLRQT